MARICLFGGSFDPIHAGHLHIARAAQQACAIDELVFLPAACSPFKTDSKHLFSDAQRIQLLQDATGHLPWARVSKLDLTLPHPSYSWRLVEHWRSTAPDCELYWLMGVDQWQELKRWGRYNYLVENLHFIVYHRDAEPQPREGVRSTFLSGHHPASASAIREAIKTGTRPPADYLCKGSWERIQQMLSH
ncbi:MAG: nicotinate (nicotinamide) nucleotide adenylyltransferase [Akkermansia sp.]